MIRFLDLALGLVVLACYLLERQDDRRENLTDSACNAAEAMRQQAVYWQDQAEQLAGQVDELESQLKATEE